MEETTSPDNKKEKKINPIGITLFGERFTGFQKIGEYKDLIPAFKDYYYERRLADVNATISSILQGFNETICDPLGRGFFPYTNNVKQWRAKWDLDVRRLLQEQKSGKLNEEFGIVPRATITQVLKTRDANDDLILGGTDDNALEAGVRTLGGELVNDALQMLRDDQEIGEVYDDETLIKRRNYVVNVFAHTTRLVHGKAALMLKASEEKRNNAGFLMSLLSRASAGKMSDDEMQMLKTAYAPKQNGEPQPA